MLREYLKPELSEDSKIKSMLENHADKIYNVINQEIITYEDFKKLVKAIFNNRSEFRPKQCSYTYEWKLQQTYDKYLLFKKKWSKGEKSQKIVEAICDLISEKII